MKESKSTEISLVAASERERAQTIVFGYGVVGPIKGLNFFSRIFWKVERDRVIAPYAKKKFSRIGT